MKAFLISIFLHSIQSIMKWVFINRSTVLCLFQQENSSILQHKMLVFIKVLPCLFSLNKNKTVWKIFNWKLFCFPLYGVSLQQSLFIKMKAFAHPMWICVPCHCGFISQVRITFLSSNSHCHRNWTTEAWRSLVMMDLVNCSFLPSSHSGELERYVEDCVDLIFFISMDFFLLISGILQELHSVELNAIIIMECYGLCLSFPFFLQKMSFLWRVCVHVTGYLFRHIYLGFQQNFRSFSFRSFKHYLSPKFTKLKAFRTFVCWLFANAKKKLVEEN